MMHVQIWVVSGEASFPSMLFLHLLIKTRFPSSGLPSLVLMNSSLGTGWEKAVVQRDKNISNCKIRIFFNSVIGRKFRQRYITSAFLVL
jgi:hypothetical protein